MSVGREPDWIAVCNTANCSLAGIEYPSFTDELECGGCNTVYRKPE